MAEALRNGDWTAPYCLAPVTVEVFEGRNDVHPMFEPSGTVRFLAPCRKCDLCRELRRKKWYARAMAEYERAGRTWLVTLTYRPGTDLGSYKDVKLWLKRVRKGAPCRLRFMAALEEGDENGRPHWHLLIHASATLKWRHLGRVAFSGFVHAKLADPGKIGYVAHYASKSMLRVNASVRYGNPP